MAIIGKIRQKQGLLVTLVGLALLLFVVDPSTIWQRLSGGGVQPIGELHGESIKLNSPEEIRRDAMRFDNQVQTITQNYLYQKQQSRQESVLSDNEQIQVEYEASFQLLLDSVLNYELSKLGIAVSGTELNESLIFGNDPSPIMKNKYTYRSQQNPYGSFSRDSLEKEMNQIINMNTRESKAYLANLENQISVNRIREKYISMIKLGMLGTGVDAEKLYRENNAKLSVKYAFKSYDAISDSLVMPISDDELKAYFDDHRYEQKWNQKVDKRSFNYVTFSILPSEKDKNEAIERMAKRKVDFENTTDDTLFVQNNASTQIGAVQQNPSAIDVFPRDAHKGNIYSADIEGQIAAGKKGDVVGPFIHKNDVLMVKLRDAGQRDEAKVRHILIMSQNLPETEDAKKKALADSIMRVVKADTSKFSDMVTEFTEDGGSKFTKGVYEWFPKGQMVAEFEDFSFNKPIGSVGVVKTSYGYHIVEVLGQQVNDYKMLAIVDTPVRASKETQDEYYGETALPFYNKAKEIGFEKAAEEMGLYVSEAKDIRIDNPQVNGLPRSMPLIKWAFNHKTGAVMEPDYIDENNRILVASITAATQEGDPIFEEVKELLKPEVIKEKKAKMIVANIGGVSGLDEAANKMEVMAQNAELSFSMNNFPLNAGPAESSVIGKVFALESGVVSEPMIGTNGVYVVVVENKTEVVVGDLVSEKGTVTGNLRSAVEERLGTALYNVAGAKDWRMKRTIMNN